MWYGMGCGEEMYLLFLLPPGCKVKGDGYSASVDQTHVSVFFLDQDKPCEK